jgi:hypothetical protein
MQWKQRISPFQIAHHNISPSAEPTKYGKKLSEAKTDPLNKDGGPTLVTGSPRSQTGHSSILHREKDGSAR